MSVQDVSFVGITSKPQDPKLAEAWDQAIKQAKDAGIGGHARHPQPAQRHAGAQEPG